MTNLKPFDLEKALAGDPVVTLDGSKVLELHYFNNATDLKHKLGACIENYSEIHFYSDDGKYCYEDAEIDLFMAPKTKKYYVNIYKFKNGELYSGCISDEKPISHSDAVLVKELSFEVEE